MSGAGGGFGLVTLQSTGDFGAEFLVRFGAEIEVSAN